MHISNFLPKFSRKIRKVFQKVSKKWQNFLLKLSNIGIFWFLKICENFSCVRVLRPRTTYVGTPFTSPPLVDVDSLPPKNSYWRRCKYYFFQLYGSPYKYLRYFWNEDNLWNEKENFHTLSTRKFLLIVINWKFTDSKSNP